MLVGLLDFAQAWFRIDAEAACKRQIFLEISHIRKVNQLVQVTMHAKLMAI